MKNKILLLVAILFGTIGTTFAQNKTVVFQVSSPDSLPVYVFGDWNWNGYPGTQMTMVAPGKYTATLSLTNTVHEYLFVNGGGTHQKEILLPTMACTNGNATFTNRVLPAADTAVCYTWKTCTTCPITPPPPPPVPINVTFQVSSPDSLPVYVQGSWNWTSFPGAGMTLVGPNKYAVTIPLTANSPFEFKFVNGNSPILESLSPTMSCTNGNAVYTNRTLSVGNADTTICFTWATCNTCAIAPPPTNANVTFQVQSPDSTPVYIRGSWNNWASNTLMTMVAPNKYAVTMPLAKSATYEFKYQNGAGQTYENLNPALSCTNGNAQYTNRVLALGTMDTTLCAQWSSCNACTVPQTNVNITFQVTNTDSTPVYVIGSWNWNAFPGQLMTAVGGGKYETTMSLPINDTTIEYLYVNGTQTKEVLNPAWSCTNGNGQYTNRKLGNTGTTPFTTCNKWATCDSCGAITPSNINVKFAVQGTDSMPVYVFGSWSNWSNFPGTKMTLNAAKGVYEVIIPMAANDTIEYLYINGVGTKEVLNPAFTCTNGNPTYTNRMAVLGSADTAFCNRWATCNACIPLGVGNIKEDALSISVTNKFVNVYSNSIKEIDAISIYDIAGRLIYATNGVVKTNQNHAVQLLNNQLYIIRVQQGNNYQTIKTILNN